MVDAFNHGLMELAREAKGLSQESLARAIGCTQATISRWEHGLFRPSEDEMRALSRELGVPTSFFSRHDSLLGGGLPVFYHRALSAAPPKATEQVNAKCFIRAMQVERLCSMFQLPEPAFPILHSDQFHGGAPCVAAAVRAKWQLPSGPIHNLVQLLESKGGIVIAEDLGCDSVDALCWWRAGLPKLFFVNARKPGCRMRFSLAHELGHTVMHTEPRDPGEAEREADAFAGEFLFPAKEARASISRPLPLARLAALKPWWRMSMSAIAVRAKEADVITKDELSGLMKEMGSRGWRKCEPVEIPQERPTMFAKMLRFPLDRLGWSRSDLAAHLHMTEQDLDATLGRHLLLPSESTQRGSDAGEAPWLRLVGT